MLEFVHQSLQTLHEFTKFAKTVLPRKAPPQSPLSSQRKTLRLFSVALVSGTLLSGEDFDASRGGERRPPQGRIRQLTDSALRVWLGCELCGECF